MTQPQLGDIARQFAVVFGAIFQVYASYRVGSTVGAIAQETRSLILPASYAFAIWGPIFLLCGAYAVYQAMPAQRENRALRAIGWWSAGAFIANGAWTYVYVNRQFVLAQAVLFAALACAVGAYLRSARQVPASQATPTDNVLVAPALGLLAGWLTAAAAAGLAGTFVAQGQAATSTDPEIGDAALLLAAGAAAVIIILASKRGPSGAWVSYTAAVLWALVAVIVAQREASPLTTLAAVASGILVVAASLGPWRSAPASSDAPAV
jgi:hypothetical protein